MNSEDLKRRKNDEKMKIIEINDETRKGGERREEMGDGVEV